MKEVGRVLLEAAVVGVFLIVFYEIVSFGLDYSKMKMVIPAKFVKLFLAGVLFHLAFEYTGINEIYSIDYYKNFIKK